jgi:methionyl-tRNA formyltransferase
MYKPQADLGRPIRVVLFCGGPSLDRAVIRFVGMLEVHPEIEFLGSFCETHGQTLADVVRDRLGRRGAFGALLLLAEALHAVARLIRHPREEIELRRQVARVAQRTMYTQDIHAPDILARVNSLDPDLGLIYGGPILRPQLFQIPRLGTLGIHHGKVPQYRGKKTTFWAVFNGEHTAGVTIQRVNAGVDTGEIVQRGEVTIGRKSLAQVTRELEALGFKLYIQSVVDIKRGIAWFVAQAGDRGKLYKDPKAVDLVRCWWRQLRKRLIPVLE